MCGGRGSVHHRIVVAAILAVLLAPGTQADDKARCKPAAIGTATVRGVVDARTVLLADGREVRLAGIEVPQRAARRRPRRRGGAAGLRRRPRGRPAAAWPRNRPLRPGIGHDRDGASAAAGEERSAQVALLAQGHARVAARVGDAACAAAFLAAERAARAAGLGLWADPYYFIRTAENPGEVLAERGRFTVVEGKVLSVRESGGTIYVNFGRRWSEDFTVTILKRNERRFRGRRPGA